MDSDPLEKITEMFLMASYNVPNGEAQMDIQIWKPNNYGNSDPE